MYAHKIVNRVCAVAVLLKKTQFFCSHSPVYSGTCTHKIAHCACRAMASEEDNHLCVHCLCTVILVITRLCTVCVEPGQVKKTDIIFLFTWVCVQWYLCWPDCILCMQSQHR